MQVNGGREPYFCCLKCCTGESLTSCNPGTCTMCWSRVCVQKRHHHDDSIDRLLQPRIQGTATFPPRKYCWGAQALRACPMLMLRRARVRVPSQQEQVGVKREIRERLGSSIFIECRNRIRRRCFSLQRAVTVGAVVQQRSNGDVILCSHSRAGECFTRRQRQVHTVCWSCYSVGAYRVMDPAVRPRLLLQGAAKCSRDFDHLEGPFFVFRIDTFAPLRPAQI